MRKVTVILPEIKLVGISTKASRDSRFESDSLLNPIVTTVKRYFHNGLAEKINDRKNPETTLCVYANYEDKESKNYTYFIGEEVTSFEDVDQEFETLVIPVQNYIKFTNQPGPMPSACINMWKDIWEMKASDLGGERACIADFEVYDERSTDHANVTLDIYIGIKK